MTFQVSMKSQYLAKSILCHILTFSGISHCALIKHRMQILSLGDDVAHCLSFHKQYGNKSPEKYRETRATVQLWGWASQPPPQQSAPKQFLQMKSLQARLPVGKQEAIPLCWCLLDQQAAFASKHETAYTYVIAFNSRRKKEQGKKKKKILTWISCPHCCSLWDSPTNLGKL